MEALNTTYMAGEFLRNLRNNFFCVHPTDTLIGLTYNSVQPDAVAQLNRLKGRPDEQSVLGLVGSVHTAFQLFCDLPEPVERVIESIWPSPVTFILPARNPINHPSGFLSEGGKIGLRVPDFSHRNKWMGIVLKELGEIPLYSTSLNFSSEPVVSSSEDLERWRVDSRLKSNNVYIPTISFDGLSSEASTLVEIDLETQSFVIIRKGAHYEFVREKLGSCKWFSAKARNP